MDLQRAVSAPGLPPSVLLCLASLITHLLASILAAPYFYHTLLSLLHLLKSYPSFKTQVKCFLFFLVFLDTSTLKPQSQEETHTSPPSPGPSGPLWSSQPFCLGSC